MTERRKKGNWRIYLGLSLVLLFMLMAVVGPFFAPYDRDEQDGIKTIQTEEGPRIVAPPYPPSEEHWLGTDKWGYDMLTMMLYGAKYTVFTALVVALLRVLIGGGIGLYLGIRPGGKKWQLQTGWLGSIPPFIMVYFLLLAINFNSPLSPLELVVIQGIVMTILGVPGIISTIQEKTIDLKKNLFVTASQAMGAGKWHMITRHIFPLLKENLVVLLVNEIILVLNLIGQLGLFYLFLGGTIVEYGFFGPENFLSRTFEWAGLIGLGKNFLLINQWMVIPPILAFMMLIFSFYILSRGLEQKYQQTYHKAPHI
ncbi:MAG: ABC transporter permease subunit [Bacillaceae bacterium]|nr:ABC transporter permease subunit [Bacillaceae bacterium]